MKKFLLSLALLTGCATSSGYKSIETKYLPNECAKLTTEYVQKLPPQLQPMVSQISFVVAGIVAQGYVVVQIHPMLGPMPPQLAQTEKFNLDTEATECSAEVKKAQEQNQAQPAQEALSK